MEIYRTRTFLKAVKKLGASEEELRGVEDQVAADPTAGDVIAKTSGARKLRFAMGGKGKSGGGRVIYVALIEAGVAYMITAYAKAEKPDLTADDKKAIKAFIDSL